jgi:hypothetical protein
MIPTRQKYWFPTKRYGWGWGLPATWQGWLTMLLFIAAVVLDGILFAGRNWPAYAILLVAACAVLVAICWWKGEPPRWRWGD